MESAELVKRGRGHNVTDWMDAMMNLGTSATMTEVGARRDQRGDDARFVSVEFFDEGREVVFGRFPWLQISV